MGWGHSTSVSERAAAALAGQLQRDKEAARIADERRKLAAKIVMTVVDRVVNEIIRPGPKPEERECYEMAGELRAIVPQLEELTKSIIDVNEGVE